MIKKELKTNFHFSYAHLKQLGDSTLGLLDRDVEEFTDRGFTPEKRVEFAHVLDGFAYYPTDEQLDAIKIGGTEIKNAARNGLEEKMRSIFNMAQNVFGTKSAKYREFGDALISQHSDEQIVRTGRAMVFSCHKYLEELTPQGLTSEKIDELKMSVQLLDDAIDDQLRLVRERDVSTEGRADIANKLYDLITEYCGTGQSIWISVSEAKYNDYVIYNTPSGGPEAGDEGSGEELPPADA